MTIVAICGKTFLTALVVFIVTLIICIAHTRADGNHRLTVLSVTAAMLCIASLVVGAVALVAFIIAAIWTPAPW